MCVMVPAAVVRAALEMPISRELWAMIDKNQRQDIDEVPITLVAESQTPRLTAEEEPAAQGGDEARRQAAERVAALFARPAPRHLRCGHGAVIHLCRAHPDGGHEHALVRPLCGRSDCPFCWRRRLARTYRRACDCLLDAPGEQRLPRLETLYVGETTWPGWEACDRAFRRRHGGKTGRLRIRRADNTVLVIAARPFAGSRPVAPHEAAAAALDAIGDLHTARHAYRQLGAWSDHHETTWERVANYPELDLDSAEAALRAEDDRRIAALRAAAEAREAQTRPLRDEICRLTSELREAERGEDAAAIATTERAIEERAGELSALAHRLRESQPVLPAPLGVRRVRGKTLQLLLWREDSDHLTEFVHKEKDPPMAKLGQRRVDEPEVGEPEGGYDPGVSPWG